jgi:cleavage and polyadenylation specificity factor subunit 1
VKLALDAECPLFGRIESVEKVRLAGRETDALLLSFETAKVSLVEWNSATHSLKTIALHFYEGDQKLSEGRIQWRTRPKVVVDPTQRCAAMVLYDHQLVVIPLHRSVTYHHSISLSDKYVQSQTSAKEKPNKIKELLTIRFEKE